FDGKICPNPYEYSTHGQNLVIVNGVSKLYGLTGLRIGWAVSENRSLIGAMGRMQAQSTSCNSDLSEAAAAAALSGDQSCIGDLCSLLQSNRDVLLAELEQIPHVKIHNPQATFYSFADFSYYNPDSQALAQYLLEKALVAVVPGAAFGMDGHLRISFCASQDSIVEGVRRIKQALENLLLKENK
ncbi:MAG: aminotransferase class I/II-fold pyridoxal phosphate-dependent enzyme, partial [Clostridia bacterium]|nr:aminotransferase class I/II-fold pyridoxal phosphate-dependent enzyme [Clostridia bacterium]